MNQQTKDLANTIVGQAEAIRDGRTNASPKSVARLMYQNVGTLILWLGIEEEQDNEE